MVPVFKGHNQLNQEVKIDMEVQQSQHENLVTMIFKDPKSQNSAKFCIFNCLPNDNLISMANTENTEDQLNTMDSQMAFETRMQGAGNGQQNKSQYLIHSEVVQVGKDHHVLVCVERI